MKMVTRAQAGLRPPKRRSTRTLSAPSTAHWNGPTITIAGKTTWDHSRCAGLVRGIQNYHMDARGWNDIAYNFVECPHGYTFEGRGLNVINGANGTNAANQSSHAVCSLAGENNPFSDTEKTGFRQCVKHIADRTSAPDRCVGHRDHRATACPGNERYNWVHQGMPISGTVPQPPTPPPPSGEKRRPVLKLGTRGPAVRWAQALIHNHAGGNITVDGIFGVQTRNRVMDVQRFFNLKVDGIIGEQTWGLLDYLAAGAPTLSNTFGDWPNTAKSTLRMGSTGNAVRYLQRVISTKAGGNIAVDGAFGVKTEGRVKDVQGVFKLSKDGIVGPKTWGAIDFLAKS